MLHKVLQPFIKTEIMCSFLWWGCLYVSADYYKSFFGYFESLEPYFTLSWISLTVKPRKPWTADTIFGMLLCSEEKANKVWEK